MSESAEVNQTEYETKLTELITEYNSNLETLTGTQELMREEESKSFSMLRRLYAAFKDNVDVATSSELEKSYEDSLVRLDEQKVTMYEQQTLCFHKLQHLRGFHVNYLSAVVRAQLAELEQLRSQVAASPRANNLD